VTNQPNWSIHCLRNKKNIQAVWSEERPSYLWSDGTMRDQREVKGSDMRLNCDSGFGTATFVVGAFGFAAAAAIAVVRGIVQARCTLEE
jgi:tRNA A37 threonylcarbamoyladenosine dehydratase